MSNFSKTKLFWHGTKGSNAARVASKQSQEQLSAIMARERVKARYQELKQNAERRGDPTGTEAVRKAAHPRRASSGARRRI